MRFSPRLRSNLWVLAPLLAVAFLVWTDARRVTRIDAVTAVPTWSVDEPLRAPQSPTGYADGVRRLIIPGEASRSVHWIAQVQQAFAHGDWRVRHSASENAPEGRPINWPMPYRLYLGAAAWLDAVSGGSTGAAVENAARWADPLLQVLLVLVTASFIGRRFGAVAAVLATLLLALAVPFAGAFLPGRPDSGGLAAGLALWSVLPLVTVRWDDPRAARRWFALGGVLGGLALWVDPASEVPVIAGVATGGFAIALLDGAASRPWRLWACSGALTSLVAYALEAFPDSLGMELHGNHPLLALAWLGVGEVLTFADDGQRRAGAPKSAQRVPTATVARWSGLAVGVALLATYVIALARQHAWFFFATDPLATEITALDGGVFGRSLVAWLAPGPTRLAFAALLPLAALGFSAWLLLIRRDLPRAVHAALLLATGPVVVVTAFASWKLRWWVVVDAAIVPLVIVVAGALRAERRPLALLGALVAVVAGLSVPSLWPPSTRNVQESLTASELQRVIERDIAYWVRARSTGPAPVVFAGPDLTASLAFYGGLRGIGTLEPQNEAGLDAAARIASATEPDEAHALMEKRDVQWLILPSWNDLVDDYVKLGLHVDPRSELGQHAFLSRLRRWELPTWMRAVPYRLPDGLNGYEGQSVAALRIVDEQGAVAARCRLVDYLIEAGQLPQAETVAASLRAASAGLDATLALAELDAARGDGAAVADHLAQLERLLAAGTDRTLPWDRRVALAVFLTQVKRFDAARAQLKRCLADVNDERLRSLSTGSLFRFDALCRLFRTEIEDPRLRETARQLLPPAYRKRLEG